MENEIETNVRNFMAAVKSGDDAGSQDLAAKVVVGLLNDVRRIADALEEIAKVQAGSLSLQIA